MTHEEIRTTLLDVAGKLGVPFVILAAVLWMAREAAVGVHDTIVVPIVQSHSEFLESTRETLDKMAVTQEKQAETLDELAGGQSEIKRILVTSGSTDFRYAPKPK